MPAVAFRGLCPQAPTSFFPLMEEKRAKEDQGDDRHQVCMVHGGCLRLLFGYFIFKDTTSFFPLTEEKKLSEEQGDGRH